MDEKNMESKLLRNLLKKEKIRSSVAQRLLQTKGEYTQDAILRTLAVNFNVMRNRPSLSLDDSNEIYGTLYDLLFPCDSNKDPIELQIEQQIERYYSGE
jgi:hypothetical protein